MNRTSRRISKKQADSAARRRITWIHVLIAVVAIIECLILVTFTTFSWIESNSSLIIQNGPESSQVDTNVTKKMDIASQLTSTINLNYSGDTFASLNDFFSEVKYFEFAEATSSDGRNMYFPCRNNTYSTAGKYRRGDTIDYNTSYLYFDFIMSNKNAGSGVSLENRDVYFDESTGYTDIFTVTGDGLSDGQKTALTNAMRMSITTQVGSAAASTKIFAKKAYSDSDSTPGTFYKSIDVTTGENGTLSRNYAYDESVNPNNHDRNTPVKTYELAKSVYHTTNNVVDSDKLFVVKKNADTKVSFRIWLDFWDPDFRSAFGIDELDYSQFENSDADYWKIPNATIGIKFKLKTNGNDLRSIYFDDYTLTNNAGINVNHLTDEYQNYSVWFYTWQPAVSATADHPARTAGYYAIQLTRDSRDATHTLWSANTATKSEMEYLQGSTEYNDAGANNHNNASTRYQKSYFCYGDFSTKTAIYKWELPAAPVSEDFVFNAYSYMPNSSTSKTSHTWSSDSSGNTWWDCNGTAVKSGVGIWQDDADSSMTLLKFRDMATAVTTQNYNGGTNYQFMNAAAVEDNHSHYLVFANNYNDSGTSSTNVANNYSSNVEKTTAAMYYDSSEEVFKSYVPTGWLTGNNPGVSFTYSPGGIFSDNAATIRWYDASPQTLYGEYVFTALGYSNLYNSSDLAGIGYVPSFYSGGSGYLKGIGTWDDVEQISFSTELIDSNIDSAYRYFIGIADSYSAGYYAMIPDAANLVYSAYVPVNEGSTSAGINFVRMAAAKDSNNGAGPTAYWYGNTRRSFTTFYPVTTENCSAANPAVYDRGYWNISVLVDGTYENLIYDTLTDGAYSSGSPVPTYVPIVTPDSDDADNDKVDYTPRDNFGKLEFSYNGTDYYTVCDDTTDTYAYIENGVVVAKMIDRYRFYVNAENATTVYWRWTPYANYSITFKSEGVSKTVTAIDTQFEYAHDVADASATGIYHVVTEAPTV